MLQDLLSRVALVMISVCGTPSGWGADSTDCRLEDQSAPQSIVRARLYRALRWGDGMPVLRDSLPGANGVEVCFAGIDSTVEATYWITAVNAAGKESCLGQGLSFPRVVGVGFPVLDPERKWEWIDATGRRLPSPPTMRGVYWKRELVDGKWRTKKVVVL